MHYALLFEARSIQDWILRSGKLRDLVGASERIDALCPELLNDALHALGIDDGTIDFARCGGGAFYAVSPDESALDALAALWSLVVRQHAPDLVFTLTRGSGQHAAEAFNRAHEGGAAARARLHVSLPQATPLALRCQRTGYPATVESYTPDGDREALDTTTARQRGADRGTSVTGKLTPAGCDIEAHHWPINMDRAEAGTDATAARLFPFDGEQREIAILHADGNSLGQLLRTLAHALEAQPQQFSSAFRAFSDGLEHATRGAAQQAVAEVVVPARAERSGLLPARPLVLGGDDLTIILRADIALAFTRVFLRAFETHSAGFLEKLSREFAVDSLPPRLTACAGLAYVKANHPFHLGAHLAESITGVVKRQAKALGAAAVPSSLALHRVTTAMVDDYDTVLRQEAIDSSEGSYRNTLGAYALDADTGLPALDSLYRLQALLESRDMARGPVRNLLTVLSQNPADARTNYRRWRELMQRNRAHARRSFDAAMDRLGIDAKGELPYRRVDAATFASPLGDALALAAVHSTHHAQACAPHALEATA